MGTYYKSYILYGYDFEDIPVPIFKTPPKDDYDRNHQLEKLGFIYTWDAWNDDKYECFGMLISKCEYYYKKHFTELDIKHAKSRFFSIDRSKFTKEFINWVIQNPPKIIHTVMAQ